MTDQGAQAKRDVKHEDTSEVSSIQKKKEKSSLRCSESNTAFTQELFKVNFNLLFYLFKE